PSLAALPLGRGPGGGRWWPGGHQWVPTPARLERNRSPPPARAADAARGVARGATTTPERRTGPAPPEPPSRRSRRYGYPRSAPLPARAARTGPAQLGASSTRPRAGGSR